MLNCKTITSCKNKLVRIPSKILLIQDCQIEIVYELAKLLTMLFVFLCVYFFFPLFSWSANLTVANLLTHSGGSPARTVLLTTAASLHLAFFGIFFCCFDITENEKLKPLYLIKSEQIKFEVALNFPKWLGIRRFWFTYIVWILMM